MARSQVLFSNFASSVLAADIDENDTNIPLRPGDGVRFPQPASGVSWFPVSIESAAGNVEICACYTRNGDVLVVTRAIEGTAVVPFPAGSRIECRVTAGVLNNFMQQSAPFSSEIVQANGFQGRQYRNYLGEEASQIGFGDSGNFPWIGTDSFHGSIQVESDMPIGVILMWSGQADAIPPLWWLCDGTNGTPDLMDKFIRGAGRAYRTGDAKADWGTVTRPVPAHNHTGSTSGHALTESEMPVHAHRLLGHQPGDNTGGAFVEAGPNVSAVNIEVANNMYTAGGGAAHAHGLSFDGGIPAGIQIWDVSPTFYTLAFIMKVG